MWRELGGVNKLLDIKWEVWHSIKVKKRLNLFLYSENSRGTDSCRLRLYISTNPLNLIWFKPA
jgi:hypothetical protein